MIPPDDNMTSTDDEIIISKSKQKQSAHKIEALGETLMQLNNKQLDRLPLVSVLREAIDTAKKIKAGNALKRQMRYIGKLIRKTDYNNIEAAISNLKKENRTYEDITYKTEQWKNQLIENNHDACTNFLNTYTKCDRQKLNQLTRAATKEQKSNNTPTPAKNRHNQLLFNYIRKVLSESLSKQDH
jgi:ribosome-associated protein